MKINRVKLSSVVNLFCFIGCSIQIYHITYIYLGFKVRHEVTYNYTDQVELPSIDIMIPIVMTINLTQLYIRYPKQMTYLCQQVYFFKEVNLSIDNFDIECSFGVKRAVFLASSHIISFIKVKDIKELTIDPREQIHYIQGAHSNLITNQCNLTRYYSGLAVFLRISCTEQTALVTDNMNIDASYKGNIATLGHSFGPHFGIRFTSQFDMLVSDRSKYFIVTPQSEKMPIVWVRYEKIVSGSLPYPYETNCRNYNKLKFLHKCTEPGLDEKYLKASRINEWDSQPEHLSFIAIITRIVIKCTEWTPVPECTKTTYLVNGEIDSEKVDHPFGFILIERPITPIMYFNVNPNLLMSEYLIFVGSIIGTWFGFSIFDRLISSLTRIESKVIAKIRKNRESKRPIKLFTIRNSYNFSNQ